MTCKKRAIPSLHRDSFVAKVRGLNPDASSGNATSLYCRAVSRKRVPKVKRAAYNKSTSLNTAYNTAYNTLLREYLWNKTIVHC